MTSIPVKTNQTAQPAATTDLCQPQSLLQPRFYADQILSDADLNALVTWMHDKSRLIRYRDGWGVVCGLRVGVNPSGERVIVAPGYAINNCGRDIVVCTDECNRAEIRVRDIFDRLAQDCTLPDADFRIGNYYTNNQQYIRAVDIYLHYHEEGYIRQPAYGRSRDSVRCETSRTLEGFYLDWHEVALGADPVQARADDWKNRAKSRFDACFANRFNAYQKVNAGTLQDNWENIKAALRAAADAVGSHEFHLIHSQLEKSWDGETPSSEAEFSNMAHRLFWVGMDCLRAAVLYACQTCSPNDGIPLARLWLQTHRLAEVREEETERKRKTTRGGSGEPQEVKGRPIRDHRLLLVDNNPPYRRLLHADPYPAPLGSHNFAPYLGRKYEDVDEVLREAGFANVRQGDYWDVPSVTTLGEIITHFDSWWNRLYWPIERSRSELVRLMVWNGGNLGKRVVDFGFGDT